MKHEPLLPIVSGIDVGAVTLPKYCDIAKIKKDCQRYLDYMTKMTSKEVRVFKIAKKYQPLWIKAIKADEDLSKRFASLPMDFKLLGRSIEWV